MKTYIQPQIVIEFWNTKQALCQYEISAQGNIIPGVAEPGGGGGPH